MDDDEAKTPEQESAFSQPAGDENSSGTIDLASGMTKPAADSGTPPAGNASPQGEAAKAAAANLLGDAGKDMNEIKNIGIMGFFSFDRFYFPIFARYLFIAIVALGVLGIFLGIIGGFVTMVKVSVLSGVLGVFASIIFGIVGIIVYRFLFETILLGFKINENLEKIRDKI